MALAAWAVFLFNHATAVAGGSDSSGYLNSARLFAHGRVLVAQRIPPELGPSVPPMHFLPLGFWMGPRPGLIVPTYPTGLPLHFALAGELAGWALGPLLVIVGASIAAIWLCYLCAREISVTPVLAAAGAVVLGLSPIYIFSSLQPTSDVLATAWCLAAVWAALRARRGGAAWAWACGAAFAVAVLVRPSNLLLLPCLVVLLGHWRRLLAAAVSGLPAALWLGYHNYSLYDSPWRTGYGDISSSLRPEWVYPTLIHFGRWLARLLPAGILFLPFATLPLWREHRRTLLALALWWLAFFGFYVFYDVAHEYWWCLRFILPAFPALILAAVMGLDAICARTKETSLPRGRNLAALLLMVWSLAVFDHWNVPLGLLEFVRHEVAYRDASRWAKANLPPTAVIGTLAGSGSLYFYTDFPVMRWDLMQPEDFKRYAAVFRQSGRPVIAMLFPGDEKPALRERMPDRWEKIGEVSGITFWKLAGAR
jgi:4-amino-4-deoxy-L-arabinose transferase-like glycosyltransferase